MTILRVPGSEVVRNGRTTYCCRRDRLAGHVECQLGIEVY